MLEYIDKILNRFRPCFSRLAAFKWFSVIVVGLMARPDLLGATSVIRALALDPRCYGAMNLFFRASSWKLGTLRLKWFETVASLAPLHKEHGPTVLVGDGTKQPKEGKHMPGVKKQFQESENSAKPEYMFGHFFGGIGVLAGTCDKLFCIPLFINIQDGLKAIRSWGGVEAPSHVVQMVDNGFDAAKVFGKSLLLLDRYFLSVPALGRLAEHTATGAATLHLVTKAKKSCVAFERPAAKKPGRGRPAKKGKAVKLKGLFHDKGKEFQETALSLYGKREKVRYYCTDLLWGQKLYQELRFVLVEYRGAQSILVCTDLGLDPATVIRLYSQRFKIECMFREMKQAFGAFRYHFWSKAVPKLKRYQKKGETPAIGSVGCPRERGRIERTVKATEGYMMLSCIAMGTVQMLSLAQSKEIRAGALRYMRTPSKATVSEATLMDHLRQNIFRFMSEKPGLAITQIIREKQKQPDIVDIEQAS